MTIKYVLRIARAIAELLEREPNFEVYLPTRNGKGWIQVGVRNNAEWHEFLKTAAGVNGVTSVNSRAACPHCGAPAGGKKDGVYRRC